MAEEPIRVEGWRELSRSLRRVNTELPKGLRLAANSAAQLVVNEAKPRVPVGPGKGGHASSSIKAASTRTAARVQGGGAKYPYYPWLDFGGKVGRKKAVSRPFMKTGRYLWKSYADQQERVAQKLDDALRSVVEGAGIGVQ
ncbi:hypothetical protein [Amycolatopsis sp. Poz14]|uniref:hypothetical protein n=1 Tax=Amycolatopsis sp. Poz14 TaxID=1447705 RepID=UPI001EE8F22F|nr:hypothetical protein [Amycolatopsis sp. Poz14]MCG3757370.1 HK97 gp10 family phage protein [Amycolatopsis sp. Poz14]